MRNGVTMGGNHGPHPLEMPAVRHEACSQPFTRDARNGFCKLWMKCRFAAGERDVREAYCLTALARDLFQKGDRKISCRSVVKRIFIAQAVAAMQIADVGQLYAGALRTV